MSTKQNNDIKIGLIGVGTMGKNHATALSEGKIPGATLAGICDINPQKLKAFPDTPHWTNADTMLAEGKLDAVIVATPHYDHVPLGISVLKANLHLLVEKPIAVHKADAQRLIAAYTNKDLIFAAMFNQRTDPCYHWVRNHIANGTLGKINRINWIITDWFRTEIYYANGEWRATWAGEGGGVLLNQCPHQLDLWQWLFGMPNKVRAFTQIGRFHNIEVEDSVTAYLEYDDGMTGVFITTTGETPGTNRLEIAAEKGRVVIEGTTLTFTKNTTATADFSATSDQPFGRPETEQWTIEFPNEGPQHHGILKNFVAAIQGKEPLIAPAPEGIHSVELGNAMLYSGLTDQRITFPIDAEKYEKNLMELIENSTFKKKTVHVEISDEALKASH